MSNLDKPMSANAKNAYERGLFSLSSLDSDYLKSRRFEYSLEFFHWLCKEKYLRSSESHHTSSTYTLTRFYHPRCINYANSCLDLASLFEIYLNRETVESTAQKKGIQFSRIMVAGSLLGLRTRALTIDCVEHQQVLFWAPQTVVYCDDDESRVISRWDEYPEDWQNPNTMEIFRMIASLKKPIWIQALGDTKRHHWQPIDNTSG